MTSQHPVLFICQSPQNGDAHWRCVRPAARLTEAGTDARVCWLDSNQMPTQPVAGRVVVLQRVIVDDGEEDAARAWVEKLHDAGALAVGSDLDDDEISGAMSDHTEATQPLSRAGRTELERQARGHIAMLRAVDGVTVSTEPLAAVVRRFTDKPVIVCPNAIDVEWFRARLAPRAPWADHLTIGWTGWWRPEADLAPMAEAWARIAKRYPDVRFVVGGHQSDVIYRQDIDLDRIIRLPIAPLGAYPRLYQTDIGCCAVAPSPFSICKTPIKAWEYALAGAAVVGANLLYGACLDDGFRGMVAETAGVETADDWDRCLSEFVESGESRRQLTRNLRRHVEAEHSLTANLHHWIDAYAEIVASVRVPA